MALPKILKEPWPFGALMLAHWVLPFIILNVMRPFRASYVDYISWLALATSFVFWIVVLFGLQAKPVKLSGRYVLVPYLLIGLFLACFYSVLFLASAYRCYSRWAFLDRLPFDYGCRKTRVVIALIASLAASLSFISFTALAFMRLPNRRLLHSFIDGHKLVTVTGIDQLTGELHMEATGGYDGIGESHA